MGSWDVSCSLTGTPIHEGDACVLVVLKKDYEPLQRLEWDHTDVDYIVRGFYGDYGRVRLKDADIFGKKPKNEDVYDEHLQNRFHFFVCTMAWDWAVTRFHVKPRPDELQQIKLMKELAESEELPKELRDQQKKLIAIMERGQWTYDFKSVIIAFMEAHRNPLAGYWATGQYWTDDIPGILDHIKLMEDRLVQIIMDHPYLVEEDNKKSFSKAEARARLEKIRGSRL